MQYELPNADASTGDFEFAALGEARNYRRALVDEFSQFLSGRIIEVGSGIGQITSELLKLNSVRELRCVEPDPGFCAQFRRLHPEQSLLEGTVEGVARGEGWDAILSVNVLEHIRDDTGELGRYRDLLAPRRGALCLFVPARPEIYAPIDQDFGHFRRYVRSELRDKLERTGFEIVRLRYFNIVGYFAWWANFCVLKKRHFDVASVKTFDRVIFPAVHWAETRICRPPFGQSLMAVARAVK